MSWLREHYDMYVEDSVSTDSADITLDLEELSNHRAFTSRTLRSARLHRRSPSQCDIVMATQQPFADLSPGGGASSDASGAPGDTDSPPPQPPLPPPPPPQQQHATLAALAGLPQNGSIDGASSSGDSCDGSTQVTTAVVVRAGDDDETGNNAQGLTSPTIVGPHHYITVAVADGDAVVGSDGQGVHPTTYVQYVESGPEQAIYATSNGQMAYPVYTVGETSTMYTAPAGQYYASNTAPVTYAPATATLGQPGSSHILAQSTTGGAYIIQSSVEPEPTHILGTHRTSPQTVGADAGGVSYIVSGSNSSSLDEDGQPNLLSHATRVSPATVQWLLENYETAEGVSLPRSTLYNHYLRHCNEHKLDPVNAASFGKLIRSVFLGLRTRRLGTRGNSKYHYYGIRVKPGSQLTHAPEDGGHGNRNAQVSVVGNKKIKYSPGQKVDSQYSSEPTSNHTAQSTQNNNHHQYLGDGSRAIPDFPEIMFPVGEDLPDECTLEDVDTFRSIYREHCEAFLDAVLNMEFVTVESLWREFWRSQDNNNGDECEEEKYLSKTKLYQLCRCGPVQQFVRHVDYLFYQNMVEVLIPEVLRPIPSTLTQAIRNFAKGLESWLTGAMAGCPEDMMHIKVSAVSAFAQTLRRYTSLNHLAQAARAVLQNASQINQMLADLNRVDFHNVQEQASWVCECGDGIVQQLEADFKATLQQQNSLEQWAEWLTSVVTRVLRPFEGRPNFSSAARQFLLKWSFYSSMVIRDLTLRSAASFGSFHLIRLLYDEYMFYLVEHRIAKATGETPIAVIGEKFHNSSSLPEYQQSCNGATDLGQDVKMVTVVPSNQTVTSVLQLSGNKRLKMS